MRSGSYCHWMTAISGLVKDCSAFGNRCLLKKKDLYEMLNDPFFDI